ncbi:hypothetical protein AB2L27_00205 [Kineococcus sp. LSe6-4]|uniref:PknH-like extracellular domain-containing protein n=1 Tax=Kineococcus halophytocola TaxID=3234027 RepID=A0ABV4GV39_9ACTN
MNPRPRDPHPGGEGDAGRDDLLELQRDLRSALHDELHAGRIDEPGLHTGTRHRLRRRLRRRRRTRAVVGAFALVAAVGVPLGLQWTSQPSVRTTPATSPTSAPTSTATSTATATSSTSPPVVPTSSTSTSGSSVGLANPDVPVAYDIPDMTRTRAALPTGLTVLGDYGQYPRSPTVMGQECSSRPFDPPMVAGRQISWWNGSQRSATQNAVDLVVTGRAPGGGPIAFDALVADTGVCRFTEPTTPFAITVAGADETWAAHTDSNGLPFVSGAARVGDLIVGITVLHPSQDEASQVAELTTVLTAAVADLRASGLPAVEGR